MSTALHIGTYLQMGADFDSRNLFLRSPANGVYEGQIVAGETWSAVVSISSSGIHIYMRFKMGNYGIDFSPGDSRAVTGVSTGITSA